MTFVREIKYITKLSVRRSIYFTEVSDERGEEEGARTIRIRELSFIWKDFNLKSSLIGIIIGYHIYRV